MRRSLRAFLAVYNIESAAVRRGCRQSMPSSNIDNCALVRWILPPSACGQMKRPRSNRLARSQSPSSVAQSTFARSPSRTTFNIPITNRCDRIPLAPRLWPGIQTGPPYGAPRESDGSPRRPATHLPGIASVDARSFDMLGNVARRAASKRRSAGRPVAHPE